MLVDKRDDLNVCPPSHRSTILAQCACAPAFAVPQDPTALPVLEAAAAAASTSLQVVSEAEADAKTPFWLSPAKMHKPWSTQASMV